MVSTRVLIISYPFPPIAGGGVSRTLNFLAHLHEFKIEAVVLTADLSETEITRHKIDKSRLEEFSQTIPVYRTPTNYPILVSEKLKEKLSPRLFSYLTFLFYPFLSSHRAWWSLSSIFQARKIIFKEKIDLIYSTAPPHSVIVQAAILRLITRKPWVCDLRDPYTDGYQWHWPGKLHWSLARFIERLCLGLADRLIVNTPAVKRLYLKRRLKPESKIQVITNGF